MAKHGESDSARRLPFTTTLCERNSIKRCICMGRVHIDPIALSLSRHMSEAVSYSNGSVYDFSLLAQIDPSQMTLSLRTKVMGITSESISFSMAP
jgi:hypothetical protein